MRIPASPHFTPISLEPTFNADRAVLEGGLGAGTSSVPDWSLREGYGEWTLRGIPFSMGEAGRPNVILLDPAQVEADVRIEFSPVLATYFVVLHAVEDVPRSLPETFGVIGSIPGAGDNMGNALGSHVSDYALRYADGTEAVASIRRRFEVQQRHITWGASPFVAQPARDVSVFNTGTEDYLLSQVAAQPYGRGETRHDAGRTIEIENLWLYALPNPHPDKPVSALVLRPRNERSLVYGVSATALTDHPLRPGVRRKLRMTLPEGVTLNALGELDPESRSPEIAIDLGTVISARAELDYGHQRWLNESPEVQPELRRDAVIVEYASHPAARLYVATGSDAYLGSDLPGNASPTGEPELQIEAVAPADRPVTLRFIDRETRQPVAVRLHLHGVAGEYLPPRGHHRKVNRHWFEDNYAEFVNGDNQFSYIDGECIADLPLGAVHIEISRGYEIVPVRTTVEIAADTAEVVFELERRLDWRERGWVTADTHVHFLSPRVALLEGKAEGVNVVNLLAAQWGEMFSNVGDFDGRTTIGARDFGGDGEFLVRVGTENRMQVLGHISLLGYSGSMIHPLSTGGPAESAIGDPQEVSMAEWAERCAAQGGLVVMPHAPNPQCERAANIVNGLVHGIEMMTFNPYDAQVNPYGLADWYRYQNIGYQLPLVAGSDKMTAASLLGGIRTYAFLGARPFTYETWMEAVRSGNTFVTVGPLVEFSVEGQPAGSMIDLPASGGTIDVEWNVQSVNVPIAQVEIIVGGEVAHLVEVGNAFSASGHRSIMMTHSTWVALRVRGSYRNRTGDIAAHTSAVQVLVGGMPIWVETEALAVLAQIEGAMAYVDTLAPRPDEIRFKRLRATLESAYNRLHQRMHQDGVFHHHSPVHRHEGDG